LVLAEVNVKELEFMTQDSGVLVKKIKPNFKTLGPKFGQHMKSISQAISKFTADDIKNIEQHGTYSLKWDSNTIVIDIDDVEISTEDIPGWVVTTLNGNTVALDISLNDQLVREGLARELVNRIQNLRKDLGLEVTDRIQVQLTADQNLKDSINDNLDYICSETLADELLIQTNEDITNGQQIELVTQISTNIELLKI